MRESSCHPVISGARPDASVPTAASTPMPSTTWCGLGTIRRQFTARKLVDGVVGDGGRDRGSPRRSRPYARRMAGPPGQGATERNRRVALDGWLVALVVVGVLATLACLVATRNRMGIETDSGPYLSAASNLAHGRGVTTPFTFLSAYGPSESLAFGNRVPLVDYPPLYPVVGGGLAALGVPLEEALRFLGAVLLGVNVVLVGILFLPVTKGRARPVAVALPLFLLIGPTSPNLAAAGRENWLTLPASLLSEPLFITLTLVACLLVTRAVRDGSGWPLVGATGCAALAVLTRNVGVAVVAATSLTVLVANRAWWRRAVLVAVAGIAPAVGWAVWVRV